jgi:hypothetical protein
VYIASLKTRTVCLHLVNLVPMYLNTLGVSQFSLVRFLSLAASVLAVCLVSFGPFIYYRQLDQVSVRISFSSFCSSSSSSSSISYSDACRSYRDYFRLSGASLTRIGLLMFGRSIMFSIWLSSNLDLAARR